MAVPEIIKLKEIITTLERIELSLAGNNKTTNETRVGALRRISDAVGFINHYQAISNTDLLEEATLKKIKEILLGR